MTSPFSFPCPISNHSALRSEFLKKNFVENIPKLDAGAELLGFLIIYRAIGRDSLAAALGMGPPLERAEGTDIVEHRLVV